MTVNNNFKLKLKKELIMSNKPWNNESYHVTFEEADATRSTLLRLWDNSEKYKGMQVKVRYLPSRNQFVVKTRLHPDFEVKKKEKKHGKNRKRNKKDSGERMFDATAVV
jgi:hypothetical protein